MKTKLFSPYTIGQMQLRNRICVPPMCQFIAKDGFPNTWHKVHYGKLAGSGAGLVCIEAVAVTPDGRISGSDLGLWSEELAASFAQIVQTMKDIDPTTKVAVQISHAGRKGSERAPWIGGHLTKEEGGWEVVGPSAVSAGGDNLMPREMLPGGIEAIIQAFANAAERAQRAGVDAIEIHMAHGYLLHQFLSPISNLRTDEWGGSFENRTRLPLAVFDAMKKAAPNVELGVRVSATDWIEGGWNLKETIQLVELLKQRGCSFVDVSTGGLHDSQKIEVSYGYQLPFARAVRLQTGMPTIACGLIKDARQAESVLVEGTADLVDVGRQMLLNPHWGWQAALELGEKVDCPAPYRRGMHL